MLTDKEAKAIFKQTFDDWFFYHRAKWELKFVWFPQRCEISKKLLWLTYEYRGQAPMFFVGYTNDIRWVSKREFIFGKISGSI